MLGRLRYSTKLEAEADLRDLAAYRVGLVRNQILIQPKVPPIIATVRSIERDLARFILKVRDRQAFDAIARFEIYVIDHRRIGLQDRKLKLESARCSSSRSDLCLVASSPGLHNKQDRASGTTIKL